MLTDILTGFSRPASDTWGFSSSGTGQFIFNNQGIRLSGADAYQFGPSYNATADTGISRDGAAALIAFGAGAQGDETALIRSANSCRITSTVSLSTSATNVCVFNLPSVAKGWFLSCNFLWQVSAGTSPSISFGVNAQQTPTGTTHIAGTILTTNANNSAPVGQQGSVALSASGGLNVVTASALTTSSTNFQASMFGTILASGTAGTFTITSTGSGSGFMGAILSGSGCTLQ